MDFEKLHISISYQQPIELLFQFSLEVLATYNGVDNLDVTFDDAIMPIICGAISEKGVFIKKSAMDIIGKTREAKLSLKLLLIVNPPSLELKCIIDKLLENNFHKSLQISRVYENGKLEILYFDS